MRILIGVTLLCAISLSGALVAQPQTRLVPTQYPTIQAGIAAANPGDTVLVLPGTYVETISIAKSITVRSRDGAAATTIDGNYQGTVVRISGSGSPVLDGFTITKGTGVLSGTNGYAGGISCRADQPVIRNNVITKNWITIAPVPGSRGNGGGIYVAAGAPLIADNTIDQNSCSGGRGGGIYCIPSGGVAVIRGNVITRNGGAWGGGLFVRGAVVVEENFISNNTVSEGRYNPGPSGAGIDCEGAVVIKHNVIESNLVAASMAGYGAGVHCDDMSGIVYGNLIRDNKSMLGGGVYVIGTRAAIIGNTVVGNEAFGGSGQPGGGGIYAYDALIAANVIANNKSWDYGGGVAIAGTGVCTNNTVVGNTAVKGGGGFYSWSTLGTPIANCIFWNNTAPADPQIGARTTPVVLYSDVEGGFPGTGNLASDPQFVDPAAEDYHLAYPSPCRLAGDVNAASVVPVDFEGDPLLQAGTVPIGADAFHPHLYAIGTASPGQAIDVKTVAEPGSLVIWGYTTAGRLGPPVALPGYGEFHLAAPFHVIPLGIAPSSGVIAFRVAFPANFPVPLTVYAQSLVYRAGRARLTNPLKVEVE